MLLRARLCGRWLSRVIRKASIADWVVAAATVTMALTSFYQWRAMKGQLREMIRQYPELQSSADAANKSADAAVKGFTQSIDSFRMDERAWVEIEPIKPVLLDNTPPFGATFTCNIFPKNVGKTAATDIVVRATDMFGSEEFGSLPTAMSSAQDKMMFDKSAKYWAKTVPKVLAPGTTSAAPFRLTCQAPHVEGGHQWPHYLVGRIDYSDQFRVKHWIKFCYFVVNARGEIWNCQEGNDEDRNPETTLQENPN
jgi:hypothetical protein